MKNFIYFCLKLDDDTKERLMVHAKSLNVNFTKAKVYLDHCTLLFHTQDYPELKEYLDNHIGFEYCMRITSIGISDKVAAFGVDIYAKLNNGGSICCNKHPHITICTMNGGKPVESNNIKDWKKINNVILINGILTKIS